MYEGLPEEMWFEIFSYLSVNDLKEMRMVSSNLASLVGSSKTFKTRIKVFATGANVQDIARCLTNNENTMDIENLEIRIPNDYQQELDLIIRHVHKDLISLKLNKTPILKCLGSIEMPRLNEFILEKCNGPLDETCGFHLRNYKNLKALHGIHSIEPSLAHQLMKQLTEPPITLKLNKLSTAVSVLSLIEGLRVYAATLKELEINFDLVPEHEHFGMWTDVWQSLNRLETIKLSGLFDGKWLFAIFECLPRNAPIKLIDLSGLLDVTDELLHYILVKWPNSLQSLNLSFCKDVTSKSLVHLRDITSNLRTLNLFYCRGVRSHGLINGIASNINPNLQELDLTDLKGLTEDCIFRLAKNLPNLVKLNLQYCAKAVTNKSLAQIFRYQTQLQVLNLAGCRKINDYGLLGHDKKYTIKRLRGLRQLNLKNCHRISNKGLMIAFRFPELRKLNLSGCYLVTNKGIAKLSINCPAIEELDLSGCVMLKDDVLNVIALNLKRFCKLILLDCRQISLDALVEFSRNCRRLKTLDSYEMSSAFMIL